MLLTEVMLCKTAENRKDKVELSYRSSMPGKGC